MQDKTFHDTLQKICDDDSRYDGEAYLFIREALDFTVEMLKKPSQGPSRHVSGKELLDGIRNYAVQEFGPMALTVFSRWGVRTTRDFGEIVFNLVEAGLLGKTENDRKEDFDDGYDFYEAFAKPFLPKKSPPAPIATKPDRRRKATPAARNASDRETKDGTSEKKERGTTDK